MNPVQEIIDNFQDLVAQVPEFLQPLIVLLAGTIPFIEGELSTMIGVVGGLNPVVSAIAAAGGNFLSVLLVVTLSARARAAAVRGRTAPRPEMVASTSARAGGTGDDRGAVRFAEKRTELPTKPQKPESKGRQKFKRWLVRFGVPGASILGPLAIPTQFTSAIMVASGTPKAWVLLWQAIAIVLWTTISTVSVWAALTFVVGV